VTPPAADGHRADASRLLTAWEAARSQGLNNRAAAAVLKISEAELLASGCGRFVTRLTADSRALLRELPVLGEIKAVVRNPSAVIERDGTIRSIENRSVSSDAVLADRFELICETAQWTKGFALREKTPGGLKLSAQFFTAAGISAAKFFLRPASDVHAFTRLVAAFVSADQSTQETISAGPPASSASLEHPRPVAPGSLMAFLQMVCQLRQSLTFVARNEAACISTSKVIERVKRSDRGGWVNVLDDGLDIHLHEDGIRYLKPVADKDGDGGWLHWCTEDQAIALSVRCDQAWQALARSAGAEP